MQTGILKGIATRPKARAEMIQSNSAQVSVDMGIVGDYRGTKVKRRQVTVLALEEWISTCADLKARLSWTERRANLLVEGLHFKDSTGQHLQIGDVILEITGETTPCARMDEVKTGLMSALTTDWRGGVLCQVIQSGKITVGDSITQVKFRLEMM